jgi:toxin ParE1/3/4
MKLHWLTSGSMSLRRHLAYIAARHPDVAVRVCRRIRLAVLRLSEFPDSGRLGQEPGTWEVAVPGLPYLVVYRVRPAGVEILRVFHTSMNIPTANPPSEPASSMF